MAQPTVPKYMADAPMRAYLAEVTGDVYEERIDQTWLNILRFYFPREDFGLGRESYPDDPKVSKKKLNVCVTNVRQGRLQKVFFIESKRFPDRAENNADWAQSYRWSAHTGQLQDYILRARRSSGYRQTIYGLLAIGDHVRFYQMRMTGDSSEKLTPYTDGQGGSALTTPLNINTDGLEIQRILEAISATIRDGDNDF
ncbi:hypothetical protein DTO021D3_2773 [Paecilomyces variotii]|nr:hypothetical protein DTO032I3_8064 [Paecilomyces variotii]KAJ9280553.1 hypothetical protein DTO021D3_2773 [Paecilomyces variotii]KAJ9345039.1 hypothetical protein DTO027B6_2184 [Paecilomyces variotii]KAJ9352974.1 hypothetical protein DTO027B9_5479 [Paecilomyces variotii]KAJ9390183.1 hypothetical protein DTO032I4_1709 [Paecilomyces variotii]